MRLENKAYSKIATLLMLLAFLAVFHWVSFGAGERNGTISTPFSVSQLVSVRTPFALVTILFDVLILAGGIHWLFKRLAAGTSPRSLPGQSPVQNKLKWLLLMIVAKEPTPQHCYPINQNRLFTCPTICCL